MGTSAKAKLIGAKTKANTDSASFLVDVVWDGRLWYNCTNLIDDCSTHISVQCTPVLSTIVEMDREKESLPEEEETEIVWSFTKWGRGVSGTPQPNS